MNRQAGARACLGAAVLAGCSTVVPVPEAPPPPDLPQAWATPGPAASAPAPATPLANWWRRFDDPLLAQLVDQALTSSPRLQTAQAALRQARALRDGAAAGLRPTLDTSVSAQRTTRGRVDNGTSHQAGLDLRWPLDLAGGQRAALDAAEAATRASAASLGQVRLSVAAEVGLAYIALRQAQARRAIATHNLALQQQTQQLTAWRVQAGLLSTLEGEQARAAAEQTRAQWAALQAAVSQAGHALAVLTGRPPAALAQQLAAPAPVPQAPEALALSLPADTLRQRPDVRAAEEAVAAAAARVSQARAARLPGFQIGGSVGLQALTLGALTQGASRVTSLLASVGLPAFDGGAARAQVQAQDAALDQARASHRASVLQALKDVEDALVALHGDRERVARLQAAAEAAGLAARLARQRFDSGLVDFQTVLDTQRTQLGTQDSLASARADVSADHVRLYQALGGGWEPDAAPPAGPRPASATP